jgi:AraC-like DNA-binding protein
MLAVAPNVPLRNTRFDKHAFNALGVELMGLSELRRRVPSHVMRVPERVDFFMLLQVTQGSGAHMVDFEQTTLSAGTVVFVRPGQVQQWCLDDELEGTLVLVAAHAMAPTAAAMIDGTGESLSLGEWPAVFVLPTPVQIEIQRSMQQLQSDFERFDGSALDAALIRQDVRSVLMRLARWLGAIDGLHAGKSPEQTVYRLFLRELEAGFRQRHGVQDYAAKMGYAESTLTRACKAAEGRSAKQVIDRRIALEAARELVHGPASVSEIAHRLGFSEATNFVKFFARLHGLPPQAFRHSMGLR